MKIDYEIIKSDKTFKFIHMFYIVLCLFSTGYMVFEEIEKWWIIIPIVALYAFVMILRHCNIIKNRKWLLLSPYIELIIILPLAFINRTSAIALWFILLLNIDVLIDYSSKFGVIFTCIGYISYMSGYFYKLNPTSIAQVVILLFLSAIQYTIIMSVGFIAKRFYVQNIKYKELMAQQKVQMLKLEQMAVIKERNRMAGEIHDSVGHNLTTALVQIEAASAMIDKDSNQTKRRLSIVKEQVKISLNELRNSIRELKDDNFEDFESSLNELCRSVFKTTSINVNTEFDNVESIPYTHRKAIYNMVMEVITNAIKHGRCNNVNVKIKERNDNIQIMISNDGIIPYNIEPGYGLTKMRERIETLSGHIKNYNGKSGFTVEANIPSSKELIKNE